MDWEDDDDGQDVRMEEVLRGDMPLGMSHEGGELVDLATEYRERMWVDSFTLHWLTTYLLFNRCHVRINYRTRNDHAENIHTHFAQQLDRLTDVYIQHDLERSTPHSTLSPSMEAALPCLGGTPHCIRVVGIFGKPNWIHTIYLSNSSWVESHIDTIILAPQDLVVVEFMCKGSICCSPINPHSCDWP